MATKPGLYANIAAKRERIEREKAAGKSKKEALAIALNTEREYAKGSRKSKLEATYDKYVKEKD